MLTNTRMSWRTLCLVILSVTILFPSVLFGQGFTGFDSATLPPVSNSPGDWGLKIVVLNVGQADAILIMTPNGDVVLVDSGKYKKDGTQIADFLSSKTLNAVGNIKTVDLLFTTHYDQDHIGGLHGLVERGVRIRKAFDQGLSSKRHLTTATGSESVYGRYVAAIGDPNNNLKQDGDEPNFARHAIHYGHVEKTGLEDQVEIRCVSVRGDTKGDGHDFDLDPANGGSSFDENPGSIALLVRLGEFEFYTAGDQTDDDWKSKKAVEEAVLDSGAIVGGNDIDVIKVSHHGSDTSTSKALVEKMDPEVAIISTKFTKGDKFPKKIVLKQFQNNRCYVLITGDGTNPDTQDYTASSATSEDDNFAALDTAVFNNQGNLTVLISHDGNRYTVIGDSFAKTFSAKDTDNQH